jgi:hypothetical protein
MAAAPWRGSRQVIQPSAVQVDGVKRSTWG